MAQQGILAQLKPSANTDTLLYSAPINASSSSVLTITNDGTGSAYDVAIKDYDQKLVVDGSGAYKLHKGDIITGYRFALSTPMDTTTSILAGATLASDDAEKSAKFESFYVPAFKEVFVKTISIRQITVESASGVFNAGESLTKGSGGNTTTALIYGTGSDPNVLYCGPSTLNGTGTEFAAGDSVNNGSGVTATVSTGGIGSASNDWVFSTTTAGGTYNINIKGPLEFFGDRPYRFNVSDGTMSGRDFHLSTVANGEFGPDGTAGNSDDGTEYTTGKTTNGSAGSAGAYVQYDFSNAATPSTLYFYDGGTGTAGNSVYGGSDRSLAKQTTYQYDEIFVYDVDGTWVNSTDSFTLGGTTYTVNSKTVEPYGYVRSYSGTDLYVVKGSGSGDFAGSDTFRDNPKLGTASRSTVTVSSVGVATAAVEADNYFVKGVSNGSNEIDKITSIVVGPGERIVVKSTTANNVFHLLGFEDNSSAFTTRVFNQA
tara:strand:+ start:4850 stop:6304 length:1455 start_codon:yes stop_codon:yes gene_type:complete